MRYNNIYPTPDTLSCHSNVICISFVCMLTSDRPAQRFNDPTSQYYGHLRRLVSCTSGEHSSMGLCAMLVDVKLNVVFMLALIGC